MSNKNEPLENLSLQEVILKNLSFYDFMNFEKIILDLSEEDLADLKDANKLEFEKALKELEKDKKIIVKIENGEMLWKKKFPKRSILSRVKSLFYRN